MGRDLQIVVDGRRFGLLQKVEVMLFLMRERMTRPDWMLPGQDGLMSGSREASRDFHHSGGRNVSQTQLPAANVVKSPTGRGSPIACVGSHVRFSGIHMAIILTEYRPI